MILITHSVEVRGCNPIDYAMNPLTSTLPTPHSQANESTEVPRRVCMVRLPLALDGAGNVCGRTAQRTMSHIESRVHHSYGLEEKPAAAFNQKDRMTTIGAQGAVKRAYNECTSNGHLPNGLRACGTPSLHRCDATHAHRFLALLGSPTCSRGLPTRDR